MGDACIDKGSETARARPAARGFRAHLSLAVVLAAPLLLAGCANRIISLEHDPNQPLVCDSSNTVCGVSDIAISQFRLKGEGTCGAIGVKWGDGTQETMPGNFHLFSDRTLSLSHKYREQYYPYGPLAWPGPKTVHAYSASNCTGEAKLRINVLTERTDPSGSVIFSPAYDLQLRQPTTTACAAIPNTRPVRAGATVHISDILGTKINFGCAFDACTNSMDGRADPTPSNFPFPGMRKHSLVLRIVAADGREQIVQGGTRTSFVVSNDGPLEFCVNDTILSDNSGAWGIRILVDETTVP